MTRATSRYLTLVLALAVTASALAEPQPVPIGVIMAFSGELAKHGRKIREGIELAAAASPVKARFIFEDGEVTKQKALSAYHKLTTIDRVRFIIGPFGPDQSFVIAPQALKKDVLLIAISLCDPRFKGFSNLYCTYPSQAAQMRPLTDYFVATLKARGLRIATVFEEVQAASPYDQLVAEFAKDSGSELVAQETFMSGQTDFRVNLLKLKERAADLLMVGTLSPETALNIFRQAKAIGFEPRYRWYFSEHDSTFFERNQELLEGVFTEAVPLLDKAFVARFVEQYGREPDLYHAIGHDAAAVLLQALQQAPLADMRQIARLLIKNPPAKSAIVGFRFNSERAIAADVQATVIRSGKQTILEQAPN